MIKFLKEPQPGQLVKVYLNDTHDAAGLKISDQFTYGEVIRVETQKIGKRVFDSVLLKPARYNDYTLNEFDFFLEQSRVTFFTLNGLQDFKIKTPC